VTANQLHAKFLLHAYSIGVFPMADPEGDIYWYSPDPRAVIELSDFKIPRSLRQRIKKGGYDIRFNTCFDQIIRQCADRPEGTWISEEIIDAYCRLHRLGFAHSVETYYGNDLAGGLYGVCLGGAFFGESMFTKITEGSKLALVSLVEHLIKRGLDLLDVQFKTGHLSRFGAIEIPRDEYLQRLQHALAIDCSFCP